MASTGTHSGASPADIGHDGFDPPAGLGGQLRGRGFDSGTVPVADCDVRASERKYAGHFESKAAASACDKRAPVREIKRSVEVTVVRFLR